MNLAEYMPQALAALDAEPESRLAVALNNLKRADDNYMRRGRVRLSGDICAAIGVLRVGSVCGEW
jgi:hypothetical protein